MANPKKISRRRFLTLAGGAVGASVLCCGGLAAVGLTPTGIDFVENNCGEERAMDQKILVAYASKCGSTGEVAQAVAEVLCAAGASVDTRRVGEVKDLKGYQAVVLGSALRMQKVLPEAGQFARRFGKQLGQLPTAYFTVGIGMRTDTPENRKASETALQPLLSVRQPVSMGMFAGKVDYSKLEPLMKMMLSFDKDPNSEMREGDWRDWDAIRAWAQELALKFMG